MDFNTLINKMPEPGGFASLQDYSWQGGGNVGSAIVAAARLGAKCGMMGVVGDDAYGQFCIDDFKRHNIDISHIIKDAGNATSFCMCLARVKLWREALLPSREPEDNLTKLNWIKNTSRRLNTSIWDQWANRKYRPLFGQGKWVLRSWMMPVYFNPDTDAHTNLIDIFVGSRHYYNGLFKDDNYEKNCREIQKTRSENRGIHAGR